MEEHDYKLEAKVKLDLWLKEHPTGIDFSKPIEEDKHGKEHILHESKTTS